MKVNDRSAAHGWYWVRDAFKLFAKSPALWIALTVVMIIMWLMAGMVPLIGPLVIGVLSPVLIAGLMAGARKVEKGGELELADLFTGFRENLKPLAVVGAIALALQLLIAGVMLLMGYKELPMPVAGRAPDLVELQNYLSQIALPMLVGLALAMPLSMAFWFPPSLLIFNKKMNPIDAIKWSFYACIANIVPFLIYGLVIMGLMMLMPFTLFLGFIVLLPVLVISFYTAYKDIFDETTETQVINPPETA
jgi:hypothetical protein